jgi:hypothetical protein
LIEVVLDIVTQHEPMTDARQLMNLAAESAKSLGGHRLLGCINAFADHHLRLFISENYSRCQSMVCCPGPGRVFLPESLFSQSG